ncbi:unnamed protein product [Oppiella nova]|uniref:Protein kinase domain-containing protein n=1 Tax=Oppiella nova TaxID=334625 RepID=A0A7R9M6Z6_9ACAR|nr:unnamed protein product [Oppiella nova]CAG2171398.1 unnamed protein product [Oppiella nova]
MHHEGYIQEQLDQIREVSIMKSLNSVHVVTINDIWCSPNTAYIIMELCDCDLNVLIDSMQIIYKFGDCVEPNEFEYFISLSIFTEIAQGVNYIHTQTRPIIHKDLKPANILMAKDCSLKLSDFGLAKVLVDKGSITHTAGAGSEWFIAPEVSISSNNHHYNESCDMYSLVWRYQIIVTRKELQSPYTLRFRHYNYNYNYLNISIISGRHIPVRTTESVLSMGNRKRQ